ncbi:MAG: AraC family transcriptional regulator [Oscillospiraceae bacterium]|nr:AraC family transcriptional regulator [Oscillospiraceae bacterium]
MKKPNIIYKKDYLDKNCSFGISYVNESLNNPEMFHIHEFIEICYVAGGCGKHDIDGYTSDAGKGDLFIIDLDMGYQFYSENPDDNLMTYNVMFTSGFINDFEFTGDEFKDFNKFRLFKNFFPRLSPKHDLHFDFGEQSEIEYIISRIYDEYQKKQIGYIPVIKGYLTVFIAKIMQGLSKYSSDDVFRLYDTNHEMIQKIIENIRQNYQSKINLDELAQKSLFSKGHLCNTFKKETGMTLSEYINRLRIQEACKTIENDPHINLSELAYKIGFGGYKQFYKIFVEIVGMSPKEKRDHSLKFGK